MLRTFSEPPSASSPSLLFQDHSDPPVYDPNQGPDPFVIPFLQHVLGSKRWQIFSTSPADKKIKYRKNASDTIIDYLLKAEIMKEVVRVFTPDISNSTGYFLHPWSGSPTGAVSLSRTIILELSGWSLSQFSNWSRRSLSVAALCHYDARLQDIATAIEIRLRAFASPSYIIASALGLDHIYEFTADTENNPNLAVTAKTLDTIIEQLKPHSHARITQFLSDQRFSLDSFISHRAFTQAALLTDLKYSQDELTSSSPVDDDSQGTVYSTPALSDTISNQVVPTPPFTPPNDESRCDDQGLSFSSFLSLRFSDFNPVRGSIIRPRARRCS